MHSRIHVELPDGTLTASGETMKVLGLLKNRLSKKEAPMQGRTLSQPQLNALNAAKGYIRKFTARWKASDHTTLDQLDEIDPGFKALFLAITRLEQLEGTSRNFVMVKIGQRVEAVPHHEAIARKLSILWNDGAKTAAEATRAFAKHIVETQLMPTKSAAAECLVQPATTPKKAKRRNSRQAKKEVPS